MLAILEEDAHLIVVNKPAGRLTQPGPVERFSVEGDVRAHLDPDAPDAVYLGTPQRLDRPVSGVLLFAKTPKAARRLAEQFATRQVRKEYAAIVSGRPPADLATMTDWLVEPPPVRVVPEGTPRARLAVTRVEPLAGVTVSEGLTILRLLPETGRTHQLRVQCGSRGFPIVGDALYGSTREFPEGIALHARSLEIRHPVSGRVMRFVAPLPQSWQDGRLVISTLA